MSGEEPRADGGHRDSQDVTPSWRRHRELILLIAIVLIASATRMFHLGQTSLWYDEVVTMRLARTEGPSALLKLLTEIDATRAPLHPILLQGWVGVFGPSDISGRAFSCICGIVTVALVYWVGRSAFDGKTALWASWLCAQPAAHLLFPRNAHVRAPGTHHLPRLGMPVCERAILPERGGSASTGSA